MMFHGHFMRSLLVFRCLHWPSLWGLGLLHGFCILGVGRWSAPAAWHIFVKIFAWKSRRKSHEIPASSDTSATFPIWLKLMFFPNSVSLGSSAIVKVAEQAGAAESARRKVGNRVSRKGFLFQENPSEQQNPLGVRLGTGFAGRGSQARFPWRGSQVRFPRTSQEQVPRFPSKVPRKMFPARFPSKGLRHPLHRFPGTGAHKRFPRTGSQVGFPSTFPSKVARKRFPSKVPSNSPKQVSQEQVHK